MALVPLRDIASVQLGFSFREGVRHDAAGAVRVIQMRDLCDDLIVDLENLECVDMVPPELQWVKAGDILVRSRGDSATSAIVSKNPGRAVAAAPLLRVRVADAAVLPAYLNWALNQPPAQAYLARNAEGSRVKMISGRVLEELEVQIPPLVRQQDVLAMAQLASRARTLQSDIDSRRRRLLSQVMMSYVEGSAR